MRHFAYLVSFPGGKSLLNFFSAFPGFRFHKCPNCEAGSNQSYMFLSEEQIVFLKKEGCKVERKEVSEEIFNKLEDQRQEMMTCTTA